MAIAMNTFVGQYEAVIWIDDDDYFEEITSFDLPACPVDVGETCFGLHYASAVDHGISS